MKKNSKIYVAGHKGMVGAALMRLLRGKGYKNIITYAHSALDLTSQGDVERFFKKEKPEYVFLAAAKVGGILANSTYKAEFIYNNIMIAANVIHSAYKYGVKKLLNLGSSCIYPKFTPQPLKEEYLLTNFLEPTNEPYAIAKISAIKLCRYYNEQYNTNFISVMPTNLYGPDDNFNLETAHVFPALIRKFHLAKLLRNEDIEGIRTDFKKYPLGYGLDVNLVLKSFKSVKNTLEKLGITGDYVTIWGNGRAYREFLHVDDLANACLFLMKNYNYKDIGEVVNIGTGKDIRIKDYAALVRNVTGFKGRIKYDASKPGGTPKKLLDVSRMKALGWEAKIGLREGMEKTYEWY